MTPRVRPLALALIATGLALFVLGLYAPYYRPIDDAYISYRYSKNIVQGHGLTWNAGEAPVEGFTNFLLVITEVPFIALGIEPLRAAQGLSIVCVLGAAWMLWQLLRTRARVHQGSNDHAAALGVMLLLSVPFLPFHVLGGLETVSFAFHLLLPFYLLQRWLLQPLGGRTQRPAVYRFAAACFAAFVAGLCRPEGFLVAPAMLGMGALLDVHEARAEPGFVRRCGVLAACLLVAFVVPTLLYHGWRYAHFGDLLPNSYHVKVGAVRAGALPGMPQLIGFVAEPAVMLLLLLGVFAFLLRCLHRADLLLLPPLLFAGAFYLRSEHIMAFNHRFFVPYVPFLVLVSAPALALMWTGNGWLRAIKSVALLVAFWFSFVLPSPVYKELVQHTWPKQPKAEETHFMLGRLMAKLPNVHDLLIVGPDAGAMPYFSEAKWLDPIGLNDNFIARHARAPKRVLIDYMFERKPDIFILCKTGSRFVTHFPGPLGNETARTFKDKRFAQYVQVARYQKNSGGRYAYVFYARRDLPTLDAIKRVLRK